MAAVKKTAAKKTASKKTTTAKKPAAKKTTPVKKAAAKKTSAAKKPAAKKTTAAAKKAKVSAADLARIEAEIAALPSSDAEQNPNQPVAVLTATAIRLAALGKPVKKQLANIPGFDVWFADRLPGAIDILSTSEARWNTLRAVSRAGTTVKALKEATAQESDVTERLRYLLRHNPEVQQELDQIQEGSGIADTAEDLQALHEICMEHATFLKTDETFPFTQVEQFPTLAESLLVGIDPSASADAQALRNRAFWYLLESVNELRAALRYLWRKQPTKLALLGILYASKLRRSARARNKKAVLNAGGPAVQPA